MRKDYTFQQQETAPKNTCHTVLETPILELLRQIKCQPLWVSERNELQNINVLFKNW